MQSHINELEQYSRRNSIRIFGIEKQANEKLTETICTFFKQKPNNDLQPHIIDSCRRIGTHQSLNAMLVIFVSCKHRQVTLKERRALNVSGINITEYPTRIFHEHSRRNQEHQDMLN